MNAEYMTNAPKINLQAVFAISCYSSLQSFGIALSMYYF